MATWSADVRCSRQRTHIPSEPLEPWHQTRRRVQRRHEVFPLRSVQSERTSVCGFQRSVHVLDCVAAREKAFIRLPRFTISFILRAWKRGALAFGRVGPGAPSLVAFCATEPALSAVEGAGIFFRATVRLSVGLVDTPDRCPKMSVQEVRPYSAIIRRTSLSKTNRCKASVGEGTKSKCS